MFGKIKQMFSSMSEDVGRFFADPRAFWSQASPGYRLYLILDSFGNLGLVILAVAIILSHLTAYEVFPFSFWFTVLAFIGVSLILVLLGFIGSLWEISRRGKSYAFLGVLIYGVVLMVPASYLLSGAPAIHDISTDLKKPPVFRVLSERRPAGANSLAREQRGLKTAQRRAYKEVKTLRLRKSKMHPGKVFEAARELARDEGWELVNVDPERGIIEAVDSTLLLGFKDDVIIRVGRTTGKRPYTIVDMRSVSRIGRSDLGRNARRITDFLGALKQKAEAL